MRHLAAVILAGATLTGCSFVAPAVDSDRAKTVAREFVIAGQPAGTLFREIVVGEATWQSDRWRVQVDAVIDYPPPDRPGSNTHVHYLIDVNGSTGEPSIFAQG
jgi:hypothetical protein